MTFIHLSPWQVLGLGASSGQAGPSNATEDPVSSRQGQNRKQKRGRGAATGSAAPLLPMPETVDDSEPLTGADSFGAEDDLLRQQVDR